jgi:hypothetical protein
LEVGYDPEKNLATVSPQGTAPVSTPQPAQSVAPNIKLSEMTYEEFKASLTVRTESGEMLSAPQESARLYHFHLSIGENLDADNFLAEWEEFIQGNADGYFTDLYTEYAAKAPYNSVILHFEYNKVIIQTWYSWGAPIRT